MGGADILVEGESLGQVGGLYFWTLEGKILVLQLLPVHSVL